jgi:hypothetical protein
MKVIVDTVNRGAGMSTILTASGLDKKGRRITFAGDHRPMLDLADAVDAEGEIEVHVESWQVLSAVDPEPEPEPVDSPPGQAPLFEVVAEIEVPRG